MEGDPAVLMRAMELCGSSETLARYLGVRSPELIRWMIGKEATPSQVRLRVDMLLALSADELAIALHLTPEELELMARRRSDRKPR